jgi:hypothetical protein
MAKFLKFKLTAGTGELLIPISEIANVETVSTTTTKIDLVNGLYKYTITHETSPINVNGIVQAIYAAMTANPGGIKSTVVGPVRVAQVAAPVDHGRQLITTPQDNVSFTSAVYSVV